MNQPLVSVIIPNYNYANYLREAVESVLSQTYKNIEIIVVDDGSKDKSAEVLQEFGDKITVIFQQNAGVSAARNNGVANSKGEYIAFLDADDVWLAEKIEKQIKLFSEDKTLGLVHVGVQDIDGNGNNLDVHLDGLSGEVSHEFLLLNRAVVLGGGSGLMITRKAFNEVDGFDLRLSTSADWDLFYQISSRYQVGFIEEILLKYRIHGSNMHSSVRVMEHDMMLSYEKAFANASTTTADRNECYGNLHKTLAASYYHSGSYFKFTQHAAKSIWHHPANFGYFISYPRRILNRSR
jgi:glycosyltransferase involved in cell wall biosynthesis